MLPHFFKTTTDEKFSHVKELQLLLPKWKQIKIPVTVIQGGADKIVNPANLDFAREQLKNKQADFILIPEAGHLIRWQYPDLIKKILLQTSTESRPMSTQTSSNR